MVPKELLPLGCYPAIHYVLEEAVVAAISEIGIIISKAKQLIRTYVEKVWQTQRPERRIVWFYQAVPLGLADALFCAKEWVQDKPTAVLYPDEIHPPEGGLIQLRNAYERCSGYWVGLTANKQKRHQAILEIETVEENLFKIHRFCKERETQQIGYSTGRYILDSGLTYLADYLSHVAMQESEEWNDDKVFEPLWEKGVTKIVLS